MATPLDLEGKLAQLEEGKEALLLAIDTLTEQSTRLATLVSELRIGIGAGVVPQSQLDTWDARAGALIEGFTVIAAALEAHKTTLAAIV